MPSLKFLTVVEKASKHVPQIVYVGLQVRRDTTCSVLSERVFTLAGNRVDEKKSRMKPALLDSLICLRIKKELYWNELVNKYRTMKSKDSKEIQHLLLALLQLYEDYGL